MSSDSFEIPHLSRADAHLSSATAVSCTSQSFIFHCRHVGHIGWDPQGGFDVSELCMTSSNILLPNE